jgi:TonB family protein
LRRAELSAAALVADAAVWLALALVLHEPAPPATDGSADSTEPGDRIEVTPVLPPLAILDAPDLAGDRPVVPHALAQHDFRPRRELRQPDQPSGAIIRARPRAASRPVTEPQADDGALPAPGTTASEPPQDSAREPLPLVQGSDDVPPEIAAGDRTAVATLSSAMAAYLDQVRRAVRAQWHPSEIFRRLEAAGKAAAADGMTVLRVRIGAAGGVERLALDDTSGSLPLDGEALAAFRRAQPFPPPPSPILDADRGLDFRFGLYLDLTLERFLATTARRLRGTWAPLRAPRSPPFREVAVVLVRLRADGALVTALIEVGSGRPAVDERALEAVRAVGSFPAPPPALSVPGGLAQFRVAFVSRSAGDDELRLFRHAPTTTGLLAHP